MKEYFSLQKQEKKEILATLSLILQRQPEIAFAFIHGSFLAPEGGFRDIDAAIYLKRALHPSTKFAYEQKTAVLLEQDIHYPVDVKVLNEAPSFFLASVFRLGKLLFCRNNSLLAALVEQTSIEAMKNSYFSRQSLKELLLP